jgi:hypothetical protein
MTVLDGFLKKDLASKESTFPSSKRAQMLEIIRVLDRIKGQTLAELLRQYAHDSTKLDEPQEVVPHSPSIPASQQQGYAKFRKAIAATDAK